MAIGEGRAEDALLSELCGICHIHPLKYKCPRCAIQTCSLACVKRHKLWSQCSGVRNPAAYRKRTELATPASVDQDYNFITTVERSLQRADNDVEQRGIDLAEESRRKLIKGQARLNVEIAKSGAVVLKAPAGLSRNKQNRTHWDNRRRCLLWTIEWILPDGSTVLANTQATKSLGDAFTNSVGRKAVQSKRKAGQEGPDLKPLDTSPKKIKHDAHGSDPDQTTEPATPQDAQVDKIEASSDTLADADASSEHAIQEAGANADILFGLHCYLHSPNTPSNIKSLIPLKLDITIADIVQDRLLLEFPTIYIRNEAPGHLAEPFILESEYAKRYGDQTSASLPALDNTAPANADDEQAPSQIDEKKILEVLQKDLIS